MTVTSFEARYTAAFPVSSDSPALAPRGLEFSERFQRSIARFDVSFRVNRLEAHVIGAGLQMRLQAAADRRRIAPEHHLVDETIRPAVCEIGFGEAYAQPVVSIVWQGQITPQFPPREAARRGRIGLQADLLLHRQH